MEYIVYRTGWNTANQPSSHCPQTMPVARVEANNRNHAVELASQRLKVYNGQYLSAEPASEVDCKEAEVDSRVQLFGS